MPVRRVPRAAGAFGVFAAVLLALASPPAAAQQPGSSIAGVVTGASPSIPGGLTLDTSTSTVLVNLTGTTVFEIDEDEDPDYDYDADEEAAYAANPTRLLGRFIEVRLAVGSQDAEKVTIESAFLNSGPVTRVAGPTRSDAVASLTVNMAFGGPLTVNITPGTEVTIDDNLVDRDLVSLREVQGLLARVDYDPNTLVATRVEAASEMKPVRGTIRRLNIDSFFGDGEIVLAAGGRTVSLFVSEFAWVSLDFRPALTQDLRVGQDVVIEYEDFIDEPGHEAIVVQALTPANTSVSGTTGDVSTLSQTITLGAPGTGGAAGAMASQAARPPRIRLLKVNAGTQITINGRKGTLKQIPRGSQISARVALIHGVAVARTVAVTVRRR